VFLFLGEFQHTIDAKGRLAVPARFRARLENGMVLVRGIEPCLYAFPYETWEAAAQELDSAHLDPRQRRLIERRFFGTASEAELDAQGRIAIPAGFRAYAGLSGATTIVGTRRRFEIWNSERWSAYQQDEMASEDLTGIDLPF
jgi:MraZ protein